jgi:hypothetical protein
MANLRGAGSIHHPMETHLTNITHVIQLAVAPVFLLTALATLISALNSRLGRIVDRRRVVEERMSAAEARADTDAGLLSELRTELGSLFKRTRLIYFAIFGAVLGALLICLVVAGAFLGALLEVDLARSVAVLFILAMLATVACLSMFLREVFLAVSSRSHSPR